jgi:EipB-like
VTASGVNGQMIERTKTFALLVGCAAAVLAAAATQASAAQLVPHRAVYELAARSSGGFGRSGALRGVLTYELMEDCDGWSVNQKAGLDVSPPEGNVVRFEWSQATWEAKDGTSYRYFIKDSQDGATGNQRRGELTYPKSGAEGKLTTELPSRGETSMPHVLLPVQHTLALIDRAESGDSVFIAKIFDATVDEKPVEISAGFGPTLKGDEAGAKDFPPLKDVPSRHVDFAFFVKNLPDGTPDFEQSVHLFNNGIVSEVNFEFGGLPVLGTLRRLEVLEPQKCE